MLTSVSSSGSVTSVSNVGSAGDYFPGFGTWQQPYSWPTNIGPMSSPGPIGPIGYYYPIDPEFMQLMRELLEELRARRLQDEARNALPPEIPSEPETPPGKRKIELDD